MTRTPPLFVLLLVASLQAACADDGGQTEPTGKDPVTTTTSTSEGGGGSAGHGTSTGGGGSGGASSTGGAGGTGGGEPATCDSMVETDDYVAGMKKVGDAGYEVTLLESVPGPPAKGDNAWTVRVLDPAGAPLGDVTIDVYPFMPDHDHGTAVKAIVTPGAEVGDYEISPVNLFMSGVWVTRLMLLDPVTGDELDRVKLSFCIGF